MPSKNALFQLAISRCPVTIDKPEERLKWLKNALIGKTPDQTQQELNDPYFGLSPDFVYDYAAQYIAKEKERGREVPGQNNPAVVDMFRQLSGAKPLFYDLNERGLATPKDYLTEFRKTRAAHTQDSGWRNFWSNTAYSMMEGMAGFTALGARAMDGIGVTEGASLYWQKQTEELEQLLAPQGGVSGMAGQLVGNTMFSLLVGGAGGKSASALTKGGGWRGSMLQMAKEGVGVGMAFGLSETGRRFGTVAALRETGRDINLTDELTYAVTGGAVEAATEAFGWGLARGVGRGLIKNLPGLRDVVRLEGVQGAVHWLTRFGKNAVGQALGNAPKGALEEFTAQFGHNLIDKYMDVLPDELKPELTTGLKDAMLMGALQPIVTGIPLSMLSHTPRVKGSDQIFDEVQLVHGIDVFGQGQYPIVTVDGLTPETQQELGIEIPAGSEQGISVTELPGYQTETVTPPTQLPEYSLGEWAATREYSVSDRAKFIANDIAQNLVEKYAVLPYHKKTKPAFQKEEKRLPKVGILKKFGRAHIRMDRQLEAVDPQLYETVYVPITTAIQTASINEQTVGKDFKSKFASKRQIKDSMNKKQKFVGTESGLDIEVTTDEKIGIMLMARQADGLPHLIHGHGYSEQDLQNIENSFTPEETETFNYISNYYEEIYGRVKPICDRLGIPLSKLDLYAPMTVVEGRTEYYDFLTEALSEYTKTQKIPEHKFVKERTGGKFRRYDINGISAFLHNLHRLERFIAIAEPASEVGRIVNNKKLKGVLAEVKGEQFNKQLRTWLDDSVKGHGELITSTSGKIIEAIRKNATIFFVGGKLMTALGKQPIALGRTMGIDGTTAAYCLTNTFAMSSPEGYHEIKNFVMENSHYMPTRNPERYYAEAANAQIENLKKRRKQTYRTLADEPSISQRSMNLVRWTDNFFAISSWKSLYDAEMYRNQNHDAAVTYADKMTPRLQAAASIEQLPELFRGGLVDRIVTTFQNEPVQNINFLVHEVIGARVRGEISTPKAAYRITTGLIIPAYVITLVTRGAFSEDWKETFLDVLGEGVSGIYYLGQFINTALQGFDNDTVASEVFDSGKILARNIAAEDRNVRDIMVPLIKTTSLIGGLPTGQPMMTAESIVEWQQGEIEEGELIWRQFFSKYRREQIEAKKRRKREAATGW